MSFVIEGKPLKIVTSRFYSPEQVQQAHRIVPGPAAAKKGDRSS